MNWLSSVLLVASCYASSSSSSQENKLIRVVVNNTETEPSPCLRAEFTAEVYFGVRLQNKLRIFSLYQRGRQSNYLIM